ncbi:MAG: hypothetical protein D6798_16170 [Deltaproteobacteria bacterium]|nr:MAG: hypothetical protein D6798_16170 [Deltaproteobacteria bacterium]
MGKSMQSRGFVGARQAGGPGGRGRGRGGASQGQHPVGGRSARHGPEPMIDQEQLGNARLVELMKTGKGQQEIDDLADLTPSQARWIRMLRQLELLNPQATVADLAMALTLRIWDADQMWDKNGKSAYPGLILDYQGGDGFKRIRFEGDDGQRVDTGVLKRWATDRHGETTNVNHAFPAVAAQAGRGRLAAEYASFMVTSGGDTLQNTAETLMGNPEHWSAGEYAGNLRAEEIADQHRETGRPLSVLLLEQFRLENRGG